mmetsp:Transcript_17846/g.32344  ORF Transcript_17846/g.32344 Transcript_17846/m.32344 type:complete len:283 (+) Transcript_17846:1361-2209(+)
MCTFATTLCSLLHRRGLARWQTALPCRMCQRQPPRQRLPQQHRLLGLSPEPGLAARARQIRLDRRLLVARRCLEEQSSRTRPSPMQLAPHLSRVCPWHLLRLETSEVPHLLGRAAQHHRLVAALQQVRRRLLLQALHHRLSQLRHHLLKVRHHSQPWVLHHRLSPPQQLQHLLKAHHRSHPPWVLLPRLSLRQPLRHHRSQRQQPQPAPHLPSPHLQEDLHKSQQRIQRLLQRKPQLQRKPLQRQRKKVRRRQPQKAVARPRWRNWLQAKTKVVIGSAVSAC